MLTTNVRLHYNITWNKNYLLIFQESVLEFISDFIFFSFIYGIDFRDLVKIRKPVWKNKCRLVIYLP